MKQYINPKSAAWEGLSERSAINSADLSASVNRILDAVKADGDQALFEYAKRFDGVKLGQLAVTEKEIEAASRAVPQTLKAAIDLAYKNIYQFHLAQREQTVVVESTPGVKCWRKSVPIERVGLYIPAGSAPLFSTILMLGIPAMIAGCKEVILCSPASADQGINPAILYTAKKVGISRVFKAGGAQAIAAMAYGTESIPSVYKIFGPGNQYVTKAKEMVQMQGVAIDMPAGPSEVLVIADETCNPEFVAADLLSQAEHGADSQVMLLSNSKEIVDVCLKSLKTQLEALPKKEIAEKALANSRAIVFDSLEECIDFSNFYAPEHLILASEKAETWQDKIINAGSVFLGNYSCESAGDYASGTNHTLPTNAFARNYSGVSLDSFIKKITFQKINAQGIQNIGPAIEVMAEAEDLIAHKKAVSIRLKQLKS
jgi:histidinol dehydrogenase